MADRRLDDVLGSTANSGERLAEACTGKNQRLCWSGYCGSRYLVGWPAMRIAERLCHVSGDTLGGRRRRSKFTPNLALDVDYRYRGSADATYQTRPFTLNGVAVPSTRYTGSGNTNNVVASLTWIFAPEPPPPPMAAAMPVPPPPPAPKIFVVFFDWDKATITRDGMGIIQRAAAAYRSGAPV